jgi:hypothetical protein
MRVGSERVSCSVVGAAWRDVVVERGASDSGGMRLVILTAHGMNVAEFPLADLYCMASIRKEYLKDNNSALAMLSMTTSTFLSILSLLTSLVVMSVDGVVSHTTTPYPEDGSHSHCGGGNEVIEGALFHPQASAILQITELLQSMLEMSTKGMTLSIAVHGCRETMEQFKGRNDRFIAVAYGAIMLRHSGT